MIECFRTGTLIDSGYHFPVFFEGLLGEQVLVQSEYNFPVCKVIDGTAYNE